MGCPVAYMATAKSLKEEIVYYFKYLTTEQKKAILSVMKCFARLEIERRSVKHARGKANEFRLTDEHLEVLNERSAIHLSAKNKSSGWKEAHKNVRKNSVSLSKRKPAKW